MVPYASLRPPLTSTLGFMKKQIIGYRLSGHDDDSYMLGEETRSAISDEERTFFDWRFLKDGKQHPATCPKCGRKTDLDYIDPNFHLHKKNMDVGSTYDGHTIVSEKFKSFCESQALRGIEFIKLPSHPQHYCLAIHNVLEVDTSKSSGIRFLYYCAKCESYAGVFGISGLQFKGIESAIPEGMHRTNLEFAQAHEQHPVIIVSTELAAAIKAAKLKGVSLNKIEAA